MNILHKLRGENSTAGLDIGNYSLKLVKLRHAKKGYFLEACGIKELPAGTIEGSDIKNPDALIETISTLVNQCDPSIIDVVISMSGNAIISDKSTFKVDPNEDPQEIILWEAGQRSPFDVDDITLDYRILHHNLQTNEVETLLVAAKNQIMQKYIDLLYDAGLKPIIVDVDSLANNNAYAMEASEAHNETGGAIALLNVGYNHTNMTFIKSGVYHSSRDISTASEYFSKTLQRNLGVTQEEALNVLKGKPASTADPAMVKQNIEMAAEELSSGIELAFSYFKSSEKNDSIDKIVLSGGGAYIPGIVEYLQTRHETPVSVANPLSFLHYDADMFGATNPLRISALLTVATGLALRKVAEE
jgi:type IV pilus assembly protein PilM